jgi:hypothetical protein
LIFLIQLTESYDTNVLLNILREPDSFLNKTKYCKHSFNFGSSLEICHESEQYP